MAEKITILFEDNHLLVVYKPKGILSQRDCSNEEDMVTLLKKYLKEQYHKEGEAYLGLVHRLDRNTSGVMVFAKTSKCAKRLSAQIQNHQFEKKYHAVVEGVLKEDGMLRHFLSKNASLKKAYIDEKNGLEAVLFYHVLEVRENKSFVEISLKTGRFHQIRAQFSAIGHPLYGDVKYGSKQTISNENFPLEAYHLSFYHPISKKLMTFEHQNLQFESF